MRWPPPLVAVLACHALACSSPAGGHADAGPLVGWPTATACAWDGSWVPGAADFPIPGLLDDKYGDGHADADGVATPILPPGAWDWDPASSDLANWRNFAAHIGTFAPLLDGEGRACGWTLTPVTPGAVDYSGAAAYFEGSAGADLLDLGPRGVIGSFGSGDLGDGPDVLVFGASHTLDFRTGSSLAGGAHDDDLVVGGCGENPDGSFDIDTTTIHTGPGRDWVFLRDLTRSAIDLGDGEGGRTDAVDPDDGDDLAIIRGNAADFRVMGGAGDDVVVWYVDDVVQTSTWLGPNFFGGGAWGDALWQDDGNDRLVLAIPVGTTIVTATPTPAGALLVRGTDGQTITDDPTADDLYARYCVECGTSPTGRRTVILEYNSADGRVHTGYFYVTAFEELQVGVGPGARVYAIDDADGTVAEETAATAFAPPSWPDLRCE